MPIYNKMHLLPTPQHQLIQRRIGNLMGGTIYNVQERTKE